MPTNTVTLVVHVPDDKDRLVATVSWVDLLDLRTSDYRVVFVTQHDDAADQLAALTEELSHAVVLRPGDVGSPLTRAEGEYLLVVGSEDRLQPWGPGALLERALETNADLVLGRSTARGPIGFVPEVLRRPGQVGDPAIAALAPIALIRTELLRTVREAAPVADTWRTLRMRVLGAAGRVEVVADPPVATGPGVGAGETIDEVWADVDDAAPLISDPADRALFVAAHAAATLRRTPDPEVATRIFEVVRRQVDPAALPVPGAHPTADVLRSLLDGSADDAVAAARHHVRPRVTCDAAEWVGGRLQLSLTADVVPVGGAARAAWFANVTPELLIRHPSSSTVYSVPGSVRPTAGDGDAPAFSVAATIDPTTAAAGAALTHGQWRLLVRLLGTDSDAPATVAVPFTDPGPTVIDGLPIKPYAKKGFRIDVGAVKHGILGGSTTTTARDYPSSPPSVLRRVASTLKPAETFLPRPIRRRVRSAYRRLTR